MRSHEVENWALDIIDRVKVGHPVEDSRVELKSEYPIDLSKAARRIAGHANAARGEPILWLLGVDENSKSIPGVSAIEFSNWYAGVKAQFDDLAPEPVSLSISVDGSSVLAVYFETDRAPYVVKNPAGGSIQREVPWREATGVRSASRSQLLRILSPIQRLPAIECFSGLVELRRFQDQKGRRLMDFIGMFALFLTQSSGQESVFPSHRAAVTLFPPGVEPLELLTADFYSAGADTVNASPSFISVRGSGTFEFRSRETIDREDLMGIQNDQWAEELPVRLNLFCVEADSHIVMDHTFIEPRVRELSHFWRFGNYAFMKKPIR